MSKIPKNQEKWFLAILCGKKNADLGIFSSRVKNGHFQENRGYSQKRPIFGHNSGRVKNHYFRKNFQNGLKSSKMVWDIKIAQFNPNFNGICPVLWLSQYFENIVIYGIFGPFWTQNTHKRGSKINILEKFPKWSKIIKNGRGHKKIAQCYPNFKGIRPVLWLSQDFEKIAICGMFVLFWA